MKILTLTVEQTRDLDLRATYEYGLPSFLLMENAGRSLSCQTEKVLEHFPRTTLLIFMCGGGNNGGDGFVAARHIYLKHPNVRIYLLSDPAHYKGDSLQNFKIINRLGLNVQPFANFLKDRKTVFQNTPLVFIDAMLGTGIKGAPEEPIKSAIFQINDLKKYHNAKVTVVSADIPSGLSGNLGPLGHPCVMADLTVTFGCIKVGLAKTESKPFVGRLEVVDIGIPDPLLKSFPE